MQTLQEKILDALGTTLFDDFLNMSFENLDIFRVLCVTGSESHEPLQRKHGLDRQAHASEDEARRRHHFSRRSDVRVDEDVLLRVLDVSYWVDILPGHVGTEALDVDAGRKWKEHRRKTGQIQAPFKNATLAFFGGCAHVLSVAWIDNEPGSTSQKSRTEDPVVRRPAHERSMTGNEAHETMIRLRLEVHLFHLDPRFAGC